MSVPTFTKAGAKATTPVKLDKSVFGVSVENHDLLKQAYLAHLANGRENVAVVKTRGLVRGGGRKPWRQKGTGRARFGSTRNPIWRGGGVVFGPTGHENHNRSMNVRAKRLAIRQALTIKAKQISVIEAFENKDAKTSQTVKLLEKIGAKRNVLLVVDVKDELVTRATRNLAQVIVTQAKYLKVYDILNADSIVITKKSLEIIQKWLGGSK